MARSSSSNAKLARALQNFRAAPREGKDRYLTELASRQRAMRILNPTEVAGEYDAGRLLQTTLGGHLHALTHDDLRTFRQNVQLLGKRFRGGITAKHVIDSSLTEDRDRANHQIRMAVPVQSIGGRIHFLTNAGPDSDVTRHHVHIELMNFSGAVSTPKVAGEVVKEVCTGPLKFDCDCGRHTYWYRYVATVGKYNAGRDETGFPKIRNPQLRGIACKHVLRVMQQLSMPVVRQAVEKMIVQARGNLERKPQVLTKKQAEEIAKKQRETEHYKRNTIETTAQRRVRLAQQRAVQAMVASQRAALPKKLTARAVSTAKKQFEQNARKLAAMGVITDKQLAAMLGKLK